MSEMTVHSEAISAVSFDIWQTLLVYKDKGFRQARNELFREALAPDMEAAQFSAQVHAEDKVADDIAETRDGDMLFNERVTRLAVSFGKAEPSAAVLTELYSRQAKLLEANLPILIEPELPTFLDRLSQKFELATVSNTGFLEGDVMRKTLGSLGIAQYFSQMVFSSEVGKAKPHPAIFQELMDQNGKQQNEILHIGDNPRADYYGALAVGMSAILIPRAGGVIEPLESALGAGNGSR